MITIWSTVSLAFKRQVWLPVTFTYVDKEGLTLECVLLSKGLLLELCYQSTPALPANTKLRITLTDDRHHERESDNQRIELDRKKELRGLSTWQQREGEGGMGVSKQSKISIVEPESEREQGVR